jgi:hypothetical protein
MTTGSTSAFKQPGADATNENKPKEKAHVFEAGDIEIETELDPELEARLEKIKGAFKDNWQLIAITAAAVGAGALLHKALGGKDADKGKAGGLPLAQLAMGAALLGETAATHYMRRRLTGEVARAAGLTIVGALMGVGVITMALYGLYYAMLAHGVSAATSLEVTGAAAFVITVGVIVAARHAIQRLRAVYVLAPVLSQVQSITKKIKAWF